MGEALNHETTHSGDVLNRLIMADYPTSEGEVAFEVPDAGKPCKTWYKVLGNLESTSPVLIALHGGPGAGHDYLVPLADLYKLHGISVVLYDQIGCARSTHLREKMGDEDFWSFNLFIRELDNLIDSLDLRKRGFYLLGQSWGGVLASAYAMHQPQGKSPEGLRKLVIASGPASIPLYGKLLHASAFCRIVSSHKPQHRQNYLQRILLVKGLQGLLAQLPPDVRKTLEDCDRRGDHESEEFEKASQVFLRRFVCTIDPMPEEVQAAFKNLKEDPTVYLTVQGPAEFIITGSLRTWEGWKHAETISVETLIVNGKTDEVTNLSLYPWFKLIPRVRWVTLDGAHMSHWEDRERYMQEVGDFLVSTPPDQRK